MRRALVAILAGLAAAALLFGLGQLTGIHEAEYPRLTSDIVTGLLIAWVTWNYQKARAFNFDVTTGLYRREIAESKLLTYARRRSDISVAILDVNGLKRINDSLGHATGDLLLKDMASRLASHRNRHPRHTVARLGGDEFIIIAPKTECQTLLDYLHRILRDRYVHSGDSYIASAGVARTRTGNRDVLGCADRAMYRAKKTRQTALSFDVTLDGPPLIVEEPSTRRGPTRGKRVRIEL